MSDLHPILDRLVSQASPDGGWGYQPGQAGHLEPTCLAMMALAADSSRYKTAIDEIGQNRFLLRHQSGTNSHLTFRLSRGRPEAAWPTALGLLLWADTAPESDREALAAGLLSLHGKPIQTDPEFDGVLDIDMSLVGWSWAEGTFSWVEPTAWACLALRRVGKGSHPRVREGLTLLLDRAFDTGGANYGNRYVLGKRTEPIPGPTAIMLLALQGVTNPKIDAAKGYLRVHAEQSQDLEHLAWIKLALSCHADDDATRATLPVLDARIRDALAAEQDLTDGLGAGPFRLALAALALDTQNRNPFRLSDVPEMLPTARTRVVSAATQEPSSPSRPSLLGRLKTKMQGFLAGGLDALRPLPPTSAVHIAAIDDYDGPLADVLQAQFQHFKTHVPIQGKRVVLKPNLVEYHRDKVINTDPRFVSAVIEMFKREDAAEIVVAEGPGHWRNVQFLVNESGLGDVLRRHGVRFVDINHDEPVKVLNAGRLTGLEHLYLSKTVLSADVFVSLPKLKTHHWAGATLSLKNLFGTLPGICYGWPKNELHWRGIPNSIIDIALTQTPHLAIVDGIVGMEGDGPLNGTAKPVGAVVMGIDLVAVDATCCRLMMIPPERLPTLRLGDRKRLGHLAESAIPQLGRPIASLAQRFELPPKIEQQLLPGPT